ncbi:MAG: hypothetical protein NWE93_04755 [Candidatus Bathyarchaeota archaeon]|nr:hypothetical protein [Candidatus Bathyarchaeota archaeon]
MTSGFPPTYSTHHPASKKESDKGFLLVAGSTTSLQYAKMPDAKKHCFA